MRKRVGAVIVAPAPETQRGDAFMDERVASVLRVMSHGSGFSSLVRTTSGHHFVMKLSGVGHGGPGLMTELIATRLADLFGLKVPRVAPIMLRKDLPWQAGTDEFYDALQRSAGWNLGVEFVADARDLTLNDLATIPSEFLDRLALVDAMLQNVDRTRQNPNILSDPTGDLWAIDFGACRFLDRFIRFGEQMSFELPPNHFLYGRNVRPARRQDLSVRLHELVADVPASWLPADFGSHQDLMQKLSGLIDLYFRARDRDQ
jgi:hypothetical protein